MADEKLILTEGNGEFTKKQVFVLNMVKEKDFDRGNEINRKKKKLEKGYNHENTWSFGGTS